MPSFYYDESGDIDYYSVGPQDLEMDGSNFDIEEDIPADYDDILAIIDALPDDVEDIYIMGLIEEQS